MQAYDLIMLMILGVTTFFGFRKGLAWQIASLAAIVVSSFVALQYRELLAAQLDFQAPWNLFLAMLLLYVGSSLTIWILFRMIKGFIDRAKLKEFDRQMGALFGATKGVALCVIVTLFALTLLGQGLREQIIYSHSGLLIAKLLEKAHPIMPDELHELLHPYLHQLDERLAEPAASEPHAHPHHHTHDGHSHAHDQPTGVPEPSFRDEMEHWLEERAGEIQWPRGPWTPPAGVPQGSEARQADTSSPQRH